MKRPLLTLAAIVALFVWMQNSDASPMIGHGPMIRPHPVFHPTSGPIINGRH